MIINPKKELFKWGPIEFKLLYESCFMEVTLENINKYYSWSWPASIVIYQKGRGLWINQKKSLQDVGIKYFRKYIADYNQFKKHWSKYQDWIKKYQAYAQRINNIDFKKINNNELYKLLKIFYQLNIEFWVIVHVPEIANWGGEYILRQELTNINKNNSDKYLEILSSPVKYSFFQQEELELLKLDKLRQKQEFNKYLIKHAEKYYWLLNSYGGNRILKSEFFKQKLINLTKEKSSAEMIMQIERGIIENKARKKELIDKLKLNQDIVNISEQLSKSIWWQDHRKAYIWQMNYYWDLFIKEISRRTDWDFEQLQWFWGYELLNLLKSPDKLNKKEILSRSNLYLLLGIKGKLEKFTDTKVIEKYLKAFWPEGKLKVKSLKGIVVSKGKSRNITGKVKIIRDPFKDNSKMNQDDILVASMTSPEYIVAMRKAKAIITDEGGMTSHAAIVSRELGVTCIVGTKVATRALEDGDEVEVDVEKGIIKKI